MTGCGRSLRKTAVQTSSFIHPSRIHPSLRMISAKSRERIAGRTTQRSAIPAHIMGVFSVTAAIPMGPTSPQVPIPAETPAHSRRNTSVDSGPQIAGGSRSRGDGRYCPSGAWRCRGPGRPARPTGFPGSCIRRTRPSDSSIRRPPRLPPVPRSRSWSRGPPRKWAESVRFPRRRTPRSP